MVKMPAFKDTNINILDNHIKKRKDFLFLNLCLPFTTLLEFQNNCT